MATYLTRTPSSTGNRDKWTFSTWLKRSKLGATNCFFSGNDGSNSLDVKFRNDDVLEVYNYLGGGYGAQLKTNRVFRDTAAWYHIVVVYDSGNSTEAHRLRIYVNGEEESSFSTTNYPSLNEDSCINASGIPYDVGRQQNGSDFFLGYLADTILADGQAYTPSTFGETDSTTGEWKPKSISGVTFGTNGFHLKYENAGAMGTDSSGNNNTLTVNSAGTNPSTTDTPSNSFLTLNPLATGSRGTFSLGNTKVQLNLQGSVPYGQVEFGTFAVNKGKWYFEVKNLSAGGGGKMGLGISERWETNSYTNGHNNVGSVGNAIYSNQGDIKIGSGSDETASSYTDNNIIGVAFDLDNSKVYFHKEGVYQRSGDPANGTGGDTLTSSYNDYWTPWITKDSTNSAHNSTVEFNFGNPAFSISSENSDAAGFGKFEYTVPSGYYALCTRNLNTYG